MAEKYWSLSHSKLLPWALPLTDRERNETSWALFDCLHSFWLLVQPSVRIKLQRILVYIRIEMVHEMASHYHSVFQNFSTVSKRCVSYCNPFNPSHNWRGKSKCLFDARVQNWEAVHKELCWLLNVCEILFELFSQRLLPNWIFCEVVGQHGHEMPSSIYPIRKEGDKLVDNFILIEVLVYQK